MVVTKTYYNNNYNFLYIYIMNGNKTEKKKKNSFLRYLLYFNIYIYMISFYS